MATFLNKLPRELRDQIYRELLVDDVHGIIELIHYKYPIGRKKLSPAILQVCKQVFLEASMILYEANTFCINNSIFCTWGHRIPCCNGHTNGFFFLRVFERIKHLEVVYCARDSFMTSHSIYLMDILASTGCSLKTLRLSWKSRDPDDYYGEEDEDDETCLVPGNERFAQAIASLKVQNKIVITLNSNDVGHRRVFEAFASQMGSLMQWATMNTTKRCITRSMGVDGEIRETVQTYKEEILVEESERKEPKDEKSDTFDPFHPFEGISKVEAEDIGIHYVWIWTLVPTATTLLDEGSKLTKQLD